MNYGTSALTPGLPNAGAVRNDIYTFGGSIGYRIDAFYLGGVAAYDFTHSDITNNIITPGAQGNADGQGYTLNATAGYLFPLFNATGVTASTIPTKAPPAPRHGGYAMYLDASGHVGYRKEWDNGFTDRPDLAMGRSRFPTPISGARARAIVVVPSAAFSWHAFCGLYH